MKNQLLEAIFAAYVNRTHRARKILVVGGDDESSYFTMRNIVDRLPQRMTIRVDLGHEHHGGRTACYEGTDRVVVWIRTNTASVGHGYGMPAVVVIARLLSHAERADVLGICDASTVWFEIVGPL